MTHSDFKGTDAALRHTRPHHRRLSDKTAQNFHHSMRGRTHLPAASRTPKERCTCKHSRDEAAARVCTLTLCKGFDKL